MESEGLLSKIKEYHPQILCFNGKKAAEQFYDSKVVQYGSQKERIYQTKVFIAPSTSGSARRWWNIDLWHEVAALSGYK